MPLCSVHTAPLCQFYPASCHYRCARILMTIVLTFKAWASVLDGFSSIETFLALTVALLITSLILISTSTSFKIYL